MASRAKSAVSRDAGSLPEKPASTTRFRPWPRTSTQPAATTSATPATAMRERYGQRNRNTRLSWRMSRLGGRSGMLSIRRATGLLSRQLLQSFFQRHDPVLHRQSGNGREMHLAADVGGCDELGAARAERRELVPPQLLGQIRLQ